MRIEELLAQTAADHGGSVAIVAGRGRHTYAELNVKSERLARALGERGFAEGNRLAAVLDTGFAATVCLFAALKAGGVFVHLDPAMDAEALAHAIDGSRAAALATDTRRASVANAALALTRTVQMVILSGGDLARPTQTCLSLEEVVGRTSAGAVLPPGGTEDDTAVILADASQLTHRDLLSGSGAGRGIEQRDRVEGLFRMVAALQTGATLVLDPRSDRSTAAPLVAALPPAGYADNGERRRDSALAG